MASPSRRSLMRSQISRCPCFSWSVTRSLTTRKAALYSVPSPAISGKTQRIITDRRIRTYSLWPQASGTFSPSPLITLKRIINIYGSPRIWRMLPRSALVFWGIVGRETSNFTGFGGSNKRNFRLWIDGNDIVNNSTVNSQDHTYPSGVLAGPHVEKLKVWGRKTGICIKKNRSRI